MLSQVRFLTTLLTTRRWFACVVRKIERIADDIPLLEVLGNTEADTLLLGWGGTYGHLRSVDELNAAGKPVAMTHFRYISPMPKNTAEVLAKLQAYYRSRIEYWHVCRLSAVPLSRRSYSQN